MQTVVARRVVGVELIVASCGIWGTGVLMHGRMGMSKTNKVINVVGHLRAVVLNRDRYIRLS